MSKAKLKPCPFCGSKEEDFRKHPETCFLYRISKQNKTECMAYCKEDCEWAWNKRALLKSEPTCKTCNDLGSVWITRLRDDEPDETGPCPDCKSEPECEACGGSGIKNKKCGNCGMGVVWYPKFNERPGRFECPGCGITNLPPCPICKSEPTGEVAEDRTEIKELCAELIKRENRISQLHNKNTQLKAQLKASKQEADVMWEGLNGSIAELQAEIDGFWEHLCNAFEIESREELEKDAKENWNPPNPLVVALHHIWKRDPKVVKLQAEIAKLKANGNDVVCGDHWDGLSGEMIDGNTGCPWCIIEKLTGEKQTIEAELSTAKAEIKGLRALCSESLAVFGEGDQSCEVVVISRKLDQALQGQDGGE